MLPKGFDLPGFIKRGLEGTITREDIEAVLVPMFGKYGQGTEPMGIEVAYDSKGMRIGHKIADFAQFRAYLADNDYHHLRITDEDLVPLDPYVCVALMED